jgi:AraC-like DNA-binding protein
MSSPHDVQALSLAASELYLQASKLEENNSPRTKDAAKRLRAEAVQMLLQAKATLKLAYRDATAEDNIRRAKRQGYDLAREIKYSPDILASMHEAGTVSAISLDLRMPEETLIFYTAVAIREYMDKAILRKMVQTRKSRRDKNSDLAADSATIKRMLCLGIETSKIVKNLRVSKAKIHAVETSMSNAECVQRTVAVKARWRKKHEQVWKLRKEGLPIEQIASRTGYSRSHIQRILEGKYKISEDFRSNEGIKEDAKV